MNIYIRYTIEFNLFFMKNNVKMKKKDIGHTIRFNIFYEKYKNKNEIYDIKITARMLAASLTGEKPAAHSLAKI